MAGMVGREAEWSVAEAFLERAEGGPQALVLEGSAGIGKSTLWLAAVAAARERGFVVLASRPAETEGLLANVVLGDLLGDVSAEQLATLPIPRRRAFEAALLMQEDAGDAVDVRALGVAIVTLLPVIAAGAPLLIAIDDDQWMDPSSASTLSFALRRLGDYRVSVLLARRTPDLAPIPLEDAFPPAAVERLPVGPLSVGALNALIRDRLGVVLARPMQVRLHEISGGNAFYALEVARAEAADPPADASARPRVPARLQGLVEGRLQALDQACRDALVFAAAHGRLPVAAVQELSIPPRAIEAARTAGVIEQADGVIRFTHPLLASAVYEGASADARRAAHRRLAGVVEDPLHRARHLALGADGPDPKLASTLESAARLALDRGISIAAAELAEHALRLTPAAAGIEWRARAAATARALSAAGDGERARAISAELLAASPPGRLRSESLLLAASFEAPQPAIARLEKALAEAAGAPDLQAAVHAALSENLYFAFADRGSAERHATSALRLAEDLDDNAVRADALSILAIVRFAPGEGDGLELAERAYRLAERVNDPELQGRVTKRLAHVLTWLGDADRARAWLEARLAEWGDRDEWGRGLLLWYLALVELWAGRWALAGGYADEALDIAAQYGTETPSDFYPPALVALHRGDLDTARALCARGFAAAGGQPLLDSYFGILGACDLWGGDATAAIVNFARAEEAADALGSHEPAMREWRPEYIEALLQLGRIDAAVALVDDWEASARRVDRRRVLAHTTRCRGLIASARGDATIAVELLQQAVDRHADAGDPYGRARAELGLGVNRRRTRQKRAAREALEAALAGFEALGAAYWAGVARTELGRIGGRIRASGLSPSELSVATLVAEGRTNREIASILFLGERTVASHLTHIYAKLGVRSRTELARRSMKADGGVPAHSSEAAASKVPTS